jgi:predicted GNAT family N-acyltransferase
MVEASFTVSEARFQEREAEIRVLRTAVFTEEQGIDPEIDFDGNDPQCLHVIAKSATGSTVGTARMSADGRIGRMAVLQAYRGQGIGRAMLETLVKAAAERGLSQVYLNSQRTAVGFYRALGFEESGKPFMEAGIEHIRMQRQITT